MIARKKHCQPMLLMWHRHFLYPWSVLAGTFQARLGLKMGSLTPVIKAPLSMPPVPVRRPFPRMLLARILCKKRLTIHWRYRQPSRPLFINPWQRLDRRSTLCPTVHTPHSVFRSMGVFVNNEQVASGVTPDDFRAFLVWPNLHLAKKCLPSCPHVTRFYVRASTCTLSVDGLLKCVVRRCSRRQLIWAPIHGAIRGWLCRNRTNGYALLCFLLCRSSQKIPFRLPYVLHVHLKDNASFNVSTYSTYTLSFDSGWDPIEA